jgi:hypothetical protein
MNIWQGRESATEIRDKTKLLQSFVLMIYTLISAGINRYVCGLCRLWERKPNQLVRAYCLNHVLTLYGFLNAGASRSHWKHPVTRNRISFG